MRLLHYTGSEHVAPILREGLNQGSVPLENGGRAEPAIWLTEDSDWEQAWATMQIIHCDRTEARFVVVIPKAARDNLWRWLDLATVLKQSPEWIRHLDVLGGGKQERWWVYTGRIRPSWLRRLEWRG